MMMKDISMSYQDLSLDDYKANYYDTDSAHVLIDVRTDEEFNEFHLPNAVHIPLDDIGDAVEQVRELAGDKPVVLVCRSGMRSAMAAQTLLSEGLDDVTLFNLDGGSLGWKNRGWEVEEPS
jgi:rhodanese-related sulfurtransferase